MGTRLLINENDVTRVLEKTDIVGLIAEHVALKRVGLRYVGLCPFHSENTPSFSVNAEEGFYYCFGCHASGDAISFIRAIERIEFVQAVEHLASRAGLTLNYDSEELSKGASKRSSLQSAVSKAVDFYHDQLKTSKEAGAVRDYLASREIVESDIETFRLGWAPEGPSSLFNFLGVTEEVFVEAGLGYLDKQGRALDQLRSRLIFPIFEASGKAVAFGGRVLPSSKESYGQQQSQPKYKNSPETVLYSKRKTLYGLNLAKSDIVAKGEIIICEGYTDVIAFFKVGIPRAVATCGTALTEDHFARIKSFSRRIILAFDADSAGSSATEKFYQWEKKHNLEIYVAALPEGTDPGELGQKNPTLLASAISKARPFMAFRLEKLFSNGDFSNIEGRARIADEAIHLISEHPNGLVRNDYLIQIADKCRFDIADLHLKLEDALRKRRYSSDNISTSSLVAGPERSSTQVVMEGEFHEHSPITAAELGLSDRPAIEGLKMLVHNLEEMGEFFPLVLFTHPTHRALRIALEGVKQISDAAPQVELAGREAKELFIRLAVEAPKSDPFDVVSRLVERGVNRRMDQMKLEARSLEPSSQRLSELSTELSRIRLLQEGLRSTGNEKIEATGQLLVWLVSAEEDYGS